MNQMKYRRILIFSLFIILMMMVLVPVLFADDGEARDVMGFWRAFTLPRVWVAMIFGLTGLILLIKSWVTKKVRLISLGGILFTFGVLASLPLGKFAQGMGMHPSPMCMLEKPFIFIYAGRAVPLFFLGMLASVTILNLIGNKLFCGWVCPMGALQELLHRLPLPKIKIPFKISNTVRIGFFIIFLIVLFTAGISLYEYVNVLEFFHFNWAVVGLIATIIVSIAALFIFRPFCYFLCPMGLFSWLFEHVAIFRVYKKDIDCGECRKCIEKSSCPAVESIVAGKWSRPDCHACGECIELCPQKKLRFRIKK